MHLHACYTRKRTLRGRRERNGSHQNVELQEDPTVAISYPYLCVCHHMGLSIFDGPLMETDILTVLVN